MLRTSLALIGFAMLAGCAQVEQPDRGVADASSYLAPPAHAATQLANVQLAFIEAGAAGGPSESGTIGQDQNTQPSSPDDSLQHQSQPSDQMGPAEKGQMNEDKNDINN